MSVGTEGYETNRESSLATHSVSLGLCVLSKLALQLLEALDRLRNATVPCENIAHHPVDDKAWKLELIQRPALSCHVEHIDAHRKLVHTQLINLVQILSQVSRIMAEEGQSVIPRARWADREINVFVQYLHMHHSEAAPGGKFKDVTFNVAAVHIQPLLVSGKVKDGKSIKSKYGQVLFTCLFSCCYQ